jgi:hypothetical protein
VRSRPTPATRRSTRTAPHRRDCATPPFSIVSIDAPTGSFTAAPGSIDAPRRSFSAAAGSIYRPSTTIHTRSRAIHSAGSPIRTRTGAIDAFSTLNAAIFHNPGFRARSADVLASIDPSADAIHPRAGVIGHVGASIDPRAEPIEMDGR